MPGIYIAAFLTSVLAMLVLGTFILQLCEKSDRRLLLLLFVLGLPLSVGTYYLVRMPLDQLLAGLLGKDSQLLLVVRLCYAPLTEEPAKLLPLLLLLLPFFRGRLTQKSVVPLAMTLGLGFAVGEMWLIAGFIAKKPEFQDMPFYLFGGYLGERLQVCFTHAGFTVLAVWGLRRGWGWFALGLLGAMTLHFLGNFPIFLMNKNVGGLGLPTWQTIVGLWVAAFTVGSLFLLGLIHFGPAAAKKLFTSKVHCPDCGQMYRQPIFGMNMGMKRYEQCPLCKKWHWIDIRDLLKEVP